MIDLKSVLELARALSPEEQARLIDALRYAAPADADIPLHPDWAAELERRVAELKVGSGKTVSWTEIRAAALSSDVRSPEWHAVVLQQRQKQIDNGSMSISSVSEAKERLNKLGEC